MFRQQRARPVWGVARSVLGSVKPFAAVSNVQYRLKESDGGTLITLRHTALGLFPDGFREAMSQGSTLGFERVRRRAERS